MTGSRMGLLSLAVLLPWTLAACETMPLESERPPVAVHQVQAVSGSTYHVPQSIDGTCSVDVSQRILDWIGSVPNGSTLLFDPAGCYQLGSGIDLTGRHGLTLDGQGATFRTRDPGGAVSRVIHWQIRSSSNMTLRRMTLVGSNPTAGRSGPTGVGTHREGWHGISFRSMDRVRLENITVRAVWGDCLYLGTITRDVHASGLHCEGTGRHGVALVNAERIVIEDSYFGGVRWSAFNVEVQGAANFGRDITMRSNRFGEVRHSLFTLGGKGLSHQVGNIHFTDNVQEARNTWATTPPVRLTSVAGDYRAGIVIARNHFRPYSRFMEANRIRDLRVEDNVVDVFDTKGRRVAVNRPTLTDVHNAQVRSNSTGPTRVEWAVDGQSTGVVIGEGW